MEYSKKENLIIARIDKGEEIASCIKKICEDEHLLSGVVSGIGALGQVELGHFNSDTKQYKTKLFNGQFEIASLVGNISRMDGVPYLHLHAVIANDAFKTYGGHFSKGVVSATAEISIVTGSNDIGRVFNEHIGLNLIKF